MRKSNCVKCVRLRSAQVWPFELLQVFTHRRLLGLQPHLGFSDFIIAYFDAKSYH